MTPLVSPGLVHTDNLSLRLEFQPEDIPNPVGLIALGVNCPEEHTRAHGHGVRLDIWENFSERLFGHWNRLPRMVVESPFLEVLKNV